MARQYFIAVTLTGFIGALATTQWVRAQASFVRDGAKPYVVECETAAGGSSAICQVDPDTYVGWRAFHLVCDDCHAQDALGSTFAPSLVERIRQMDKQRFLNAMERGYTGQTGAMPPWGENPNVNRYYEELWSYLTARANGDLPPGPPELLPNSNRFLR